MSKTKVNILWREFYNYEKMKARVDRLKEKVMYYESVGEKITPNYGEGTGSSDTTSKVEKASIKAVEEMKKIDKLMLRISKVEKDLVKLKPHQRYIVSTCLIHHIPVSLVAIEEETTTENIRKIIINALNSLS